MLEKVQSLPNDLGVALGLLQEHCRQDMSDQMFPVVNPATGEHLADVPDTSPEGASQAIAAAAAASSDWQSRTAKERATILRKWNDLVLDNQETLAALLTAEQGKPLAEARGEILFAASFIEWFAEEGKRAYGDIIPANAVDRRLMVMKQPIGVCAAITPWNFPSAMVTRKVAPALAAGCGIVVKPAEDTPLSALALAFLAEQAGVPDGLFSVVTASRAEPVAEVFTSSELVRKLTFTGSTRVGKILARQCADTVKKLSLELGGNAPFIVFDDANVEAAAQAAIVSKFRNAGQTCVCANRIFVQSSIAERFLECFTGLASDLKVGDGTALGVDLGPLINPAAMDKVDDLVKSALDEGATVALGGGGHQAGDNFYAPTILTDVSPEMRITKTEIFGPVAPILTFESDEEVLAKANDTPYGLAAYFWTRDLKRTWRIAEGLEYGMVGINEGLISSEAAPFGGIKESGIGREGSKYGLDEYFELKYVSIGGV